MSKVSVLDGIVYPTSTFWTNATPFRPTFELKSSSWRTPTVCAARAFACA